MTKPLNIAGDRYGKLLVISKADTIYRGKNKIPKTVWNCLCDCGKKAIIITEKLRSGHTTSCGCNHLKNKYVDKCMSSKLMIYYKYKQGATRRKLFFNISFDDFINKTKEDCFYCGCSPMQVARTPHGLIFHIYNGLDRIDNDLGYSLNNVVACCGNCNYARRTQTQEEFLHMVKKIYERHFSKQEAV